MNFSNSDPCKFLRHDEQIVIGEKGKVKFFKWHVGYRVAMTFIEKWEIVDGEEIDAITSYNLFVDYELTQLLNALRNRKGVIVCSDMFAEPEGIDPFTVTIETKNDLVRVSTWDEGFTECKQPVLLFTPEQIDKIIELLEGEYYIP